MTISIADLKSKQSSLLSKIKGKVEADKSGGGFNDPRMWKPTFDKETGGGAIIQFLPSPAGLDAMPYEKVITHFFKGPTGQWYAENSLRTIDGKDPVGDLNYRLFNTNIESNQNQARNQKQKPRWFANIRVIKDIGTPENNGKTFLYEFGPAIWNLIEAQLFPNDPTNPDKESVNVFDVFNAPLLNIRLVPKKLGKNIVPSYDNSTFEFPQGKTFKSAEEALQAIKEGHLLDEFKADSAFKSFDELAKRLVEVLGLETGTGLETVVGYEAENAYTGMKQAPTQAPNQASKSVADEATALAEAALDGAFGDSSDPADGDDELAKLQAMLGES